jgi:hypothetical protein
MKKQCKRKHYYPVPSISFIRGKEEVGESRANTFWIATEFAWQGIRLGQIVESDNSNYKHIANTITTCFYCMKDPLLSKNKTLSYIRKTTDDAMHFLGEVTKRSIDKYEDKNSVRYVFNQDEMSAINRFICSLESVHPAMPYDAWHTSWNLSCVSLLKMPELKVEYGRILPD